MKKKIIIAFDIMGSENEPKKIFFGIKKFLKYYNNCNIILVGNEKIIKNYKHILIKYKKKIKFYFSENDIKMTDTIKAVYTKKNSSMIKAVDLLKNNYCDAICSAGNTLLYYLINKIKINVIDKEIKPGFLVNLPTIKENKTTILMDVGANISCDFNDLKNFIKLSSIYVNILKGIKKPTLKLLNIGEEKYKGTKELKKLYNFLEENKQKKINFKGNIEPRDLLNGDSDIVICDGWSGNISLKSMEGSIKTFLNELKKEIKKSFIFKVKVFLIKKTLKKIIKKYDYNRNGGALLIGFEKTIIKCHSNSSEESYFQSLKLAKTIVEKKLIENLKYEYKK